MVFAFLKKIKSITGQDRGWVLATHIRISGFSTTIAAMALYSGSLVFGQIALLTFGLGLPRFWDLAEVVAQAAAITTVAHGSLFGFQIIRIPPILRIGRQLNHIFPAGDFGRMRLGLTELEIRGALDALLRLPRLNGLLAIGFTVYIGVHTVIAASRWQLPASDYLFMGTLLLIATLLHGSVTYIFSDMAVGRFVKDCRQRLTLQDQALSHQQHDRLRTKFLILGQAFITALLNVSGLIYFSKDNILIIAIVIAYSVLFMSFLGYIVLRRISSSLEEIKMAAMRLHDGELIALHSRSLDAEFIEISNGLNSATYAILDHQQNLESKIQARTQELTVERDKSEKLLLNILPASVADELKARGAAEPVHFASVTVLFTDFVGFTKIAERLSPTELVGELDKCFSYFDAVAQKYGLEKLKTIGDAYMAAGGIPVVNSTHAFDCALAALEVQAFMNQMKSIKEQQGYPYWELRLGMHTGPLVAGVVGERKFAYDVWGDTVNTASRMESSGVAGSINISKELRDEIHFLFKCEHRGKVYAKNKGEIDMFFLHGIKEKFSIDGAGRVPNQEFKLVYERIRHGARLARRETSSP
jgi:class 3 adenylate cyclase